MIEQEQLSAIFRFALQGVVVPFCVTGLIIWTFLRYCRKFKPYFSAVAIGGGFFFAYFLANHPEFPPVEVQDQLYLYALAALLLFAFADFREVSWRIVATFKVLFSLTLIYLIVRPLVHDWGSEKTMQVMVVSSLLWGSIWQNFAKSAHEPGTTPLVLAIAAIGGGISILFANSELLGQLSIAIGFTVLAWQLFHFLFPDTRLGYSGYAVMISILNSLLLICYYYAGLTILQLVLIVGSLFAIPVSKTVSYFFPDISPRIAKMLTLGMAVLPIGILLALTAYSFASGEGY